MKEIIVLICFTMTLFSCQYNRSRKTQHKEQYPPQKLFEGVPLQAAQKIFDEDQLGLESNLKSEPAIINQLSNIKGYTLLIYCSILENLDAMDILLKNRLDFNLIIPYHDDTPLSNAVATNNYQMASFYLDIKLIL
jgi:ankyrin repeat protein